MPTPTYTPLANITLGASASTVTFSSIPATYRDLVLVIEGTVTSAQAQPVLRFNSDTGSSYSAVSMVGNGTSASSGSGTETWLGRTINFSTTVRCNIVYQIFDYRQTDKQKIVISRGNRSDSGVAATAGRWASTSAITTIACLPETGSSWASGTTFSLYGIAA